MDDGPRTIDDGSLRSRIYSLLSMVSRLQEKKSDKSTGMSIITYVYLLITGYAKTAPPHSPGRAASHASDCHKLTVTSISISLRGRLKRGEV